MMKIYLIIIYSVLSLVLFSSCKGILSSNYSQAKNVDRTHDISRESVAEVINKHIDEINLCYEDVLIKNPDIQGEIVMEWNINGSGLVDSVFVKSTTISNKYLSECIISKIKTWEFRKPKSGNCKISYPFVFKVSGF